MSSFDKVTWWVKDVPLILKRFLPEQPEEETGATGQHRFTKK